MSSFYKNFTLKHCLWISPIILLVVIFLNFYGLYSNKFYFLKFDNYIFPMLTAVHFLYLYALGYKLSTKERPDPQMRNVEFAVYIVLVVYFFKLVDSVLVLLSYSDFQDYIIPDTFIPVGSTIVFFNALLISITLLTFLKRKAVLGAYTFDNFNEKKVDPWQDQV